MWGGSCTATAMQMQNEKQLAKQEAAKEGSNDEKGKMKMREQLRRHSGSWGLLFTSPLAPG
jgi:hypothetical protein